MRLRTSGGRHRLRRSGTRYEQIKIVLSAATLAAISVAALESVDMSPTAVKGVSPADDSSTYAGIVSTTEAGVASDADGIDVVAMRKAPTVVHPRSASTTALPCAEGMHGGAATSAAAPSSAQQMSRHNPSVIRRHVPKLQFPPAQMSVVPPAVLTGSPSTPPPDPIQSAGPANLTVSMG